MVASKSKYDTVKYGKDTVRFSTEAKSLYTKEVIIDEGAFDHEEFNGCDPFTQKVIPGVIKCIPVIFWWKEFSTEANPIDALVIKKYDAEIFKVGVKSTDKIFALPACAASVAICGYTQWRKPGYTQWRKPAWRSPAQHTTIIILAPLG
uniref:Uncharacterized protein n=1 Tax=Romanomermis culicivorax TaxID=13658 RepID=A0A915JIV3_ROMCU